jgi:hypothetical protein
MTTAEDEAKAAARVILEAGLRDDHAQALRERIALEVPQCLSSNGSRIRFHHWLSGDRAGLGFGLLCEMTADLAAGASQLFAAQLFYPGATLVRQLLECGYLLALAGERTDEMSSWIDGSPEEIRRMFTPANMRKRSVRGFRINEYRVHCEHGGHPHRAGESSVRGHQPPLGSTRAHWVDLAQHLAETWSFFCAALPLYDPRLSPTSGLYRPADAPEGGYAVASLVKQWQRDDPLAIGDRFGGSLSPPGKLAPR